MRLLRSTEDYSKWTPFAESLIIINKTNSPDSFEIWTEAIDINNGITLLGKVHLRFNYVPDEVGNHNPNSNDYHQLKSYSLINFENIIHKVNSSEESIRFSVRARKPSFVGNSQATNRVRLLSKGVWSDRLEETRTYSPKEKCA